MNDKSKDPSIPRLSKPNNNQTYSVLRNINDINRINRMARNAITIQNIGTKAAAHDLVLHRTQRNHTNPTQTVRPKIREWFSITSSGFTPASLTLS